MTRTDTDQLHVTNNGESDTDSVMELSPLAMGVERRVEIGRGNAHAHWMSHDGQKMVTPNVFTGHSTQFDFASDRIDTILPVSSKFGHPLTVGMMPNASKYYVANLLDSTMTVVDMENHAVLKTTSLIANLTRSRERFPDPWGAADSNPSKPEGE